MFSFDLKGIKWGRGLSITIIIACTILPPLWFLFEFAPLYFFRLDTFRLLLLCAAIGTPVTLLNTCFFCMVDYGTNTEKKGMITGDVLLEYFPTAAVLTMIYFLTPSVVSFLENKKYSTHFAVKWTAGAGIIMVFGTLGLLWLIDIIERLFSKDPKLPKENDQQ